MTKTIEPAEEIINADYSNIELTELEAAQEQQITALQTEIAACREQIAILTGTHPLFKVYKCGKGWVAEYKGKTGRLKLEGNATAEAALQAVTGWQERITE